ncbi:AraC family transcriptional regulator [Pseudomonas turukhanskensis]|uniref:Transcriptional regulator n=1 Tax=Pseudomonas turukhanskensis TaxID=1806536 RepID=A0A9W6NES6_9PSED|nr:AraC family transcriptional regulator [Pseudomonas turukhanskensis]GLK88015.1 transcriptional regulator [Pseudomonas turukhanskensis]
MHAFDHLITLANLRGVLDLNCHLQGDWALDHPPLAAGQASYHLILDGACRLEVPGQTAQPLTAGDIVLLPRSAVHVLAAGARAASQPGTLRKIQQTGRITQLRQDQGSGVLNMLCGRIQYTPHATLLAALPEVLVINANAPADRDRLQAIITLMRLEAEGDELANQSVVDGLSVILFTLVLRYVCEQQQGLPGVFALLRDKRLAKAAMALLEDLSQDWSVEALAATASMSRASFVRAFTSAAGVAPGTWLLQLRVARAQLLLQRSAASIGDIAAAVGYPTLSSFSRVFKQQTGEAPAHYRQRLTLARQITRQSI